MISMIALVVFAGIATQAICRQINTIFDKTKTRYGLSMIAAID
jgi:hypothetical protein